MNELTTSWGAPGFVRLVVQENKHEDAFRWHEKGMKHYWELYRSQNYANVGISISNLYQISHEPFELPPTFKDLYHGFREVDSKEVRIGFYYIKNKQRCIQNGNN